MTRYPAVGISNEQDSCVPDIRDVYRLVGEHYGLSLPRTTIVGEELAGVLTSPRAYADGESNTRYDNIRLP